MSGMIPGIGATTAEKLEGRGPHVRWMPFPFLFLLRFFPAGWLGSRVVSVLDSGAEGPGFKSQSLRCRVTVLGKLFIPIVPLLTKQQNCNPLKGCGDNCRPGGK